MVFGLEQVLISLFLLKALTQSLC